MKVDTLQKLYTDELRDLYNAENQLLKASPKMGKGASSDEFERRFRETCRTDQNPRSNALKKSLENLAQKLKGKTCRAMKGLIEEDLQILEIKNTGDDSVTGCWVPSQRRKKFEHYEIASHGASAPLRICLAKTRPQSFCKLRWMKKRKRMRFSTDWRKPF